MSPGATGGRGHWWEGATIYHVYVRSWLDTDADGYGDLRGVIAGLDYLSWLGVDGIWLSPTMPSPDHDWGYDVADYLGVHPDLGTLDDLDRLVADAGARGIRVLLDLVPNHTSDQHPWFMESRSGPTSARRDWYVWADPAPDGGPPNNWTGGTGTTAWTRDEASAQYYLHNFLESQPDLNWWNPEVHEAFENILRFWLDRGVAGVRIDVAHGLYKDAELRDDPPATVGPESRFGLAGVYSKNRPEVHDVYRSWRKLAGQYDPEGLLLGETWVLDTERLAAFYGADDELQLGFNFEFIFAPFDAAALRAVVASTLADLPPGSCPVWVGSSHDIARFATRWAGGDEARTRCALGVLCTLPGTLVLYYGDELGLPDVDVAPERQRDPMTWHATDGRYNRDRSRTPMPWAPGANGGFSDVGAEPWLPVGDRSGVTVAEQRDDPQSILSFTRRLLDLRRRELAPGVAPYTELASGPDTWIYRSGPLVVAANLSDHEADVTLPAGSAVLSSAGVDGAGRMADRGGRAGSAQLGPWETLILTTHPSQ